MDAEPAATDLGAAHPAVEASGEAAVESAEVAVPIPEIFAPPIRGDEMGSAHMCAGEAACLAAIEAMPAVEAYRRA